jgi:chloride channel 3/4/5
LPFTTSVPTMDGDEEQPTEHTHLLPPHGAEAESIISSYITKEEQLLGETAVGERLPYNDYTTIDWLHDLVRKAAMKLRSIS